MSSLSLCMIVKDEEAVLARCLESISWFADEIVIVDTGSKDSTREIAARFTDRIYPYRWQDDFAAARNYSFSKGRGDYLFWLDADDVAPQREWGKLSELRKRIDLEKPDVVMLPYAVGFDREGNPSASFYRERIIRRCEKARWIERVHEAIVPFGKIMRGDAMIEHRKLKIQDPGRNLRILEKIREENGGFNAREQYYYELERRLQRQREEMFKECEGEKWQKEKTSIWTRKNM